ILGLFSPASGEAEVLGRPPGKASAAIGYLPQRRHFDPGLRIRGIDLVRLGLDGDRWGMPLPAIGPWARRGREARQRVDEVIERVGAGGYAMRPIGEISGGEQQRLLIAQALVRRPKLLVLDEPLDSLDLPNQAMAAALLAKISKDSGVTIL